MEEIKKLLGNEKLILGLKRTIKALKRSNVRKVVLAGDCPENIKEDIEYYGKFSNVEIHNAKVPCDELGTFCKKPFPVTVIGILK